jgi:plastocyanin
MSRQHTSTPLAALVATLTVVAVLAPFAAGCSSKDAGAPAVTTTGPTFNFTFPANGVSHEVQFPAVGSFNYRCATHGVMTGTINVSTSATMDSLPNPVQVAPGGVLTFSPSTVNIRPNGFVRWVNFSGATNHTATRP